MSGSGSLSLGRREATLCEVGFGGTPAEEDMLAMRGWVCAVRKDGVERYAVYGVDALSKADVQECWWLCFDDGSLELSREGGRLIEGPVPNDGTWGNPGVRHPGIHFRQHFTGRI